jgi:integrase/recombinase XerD
MPPDQFPTEIAPTNRLLTAAAFHRLADVPPEVEWFANLNNPNTRRVHEDALRDFMHFTGIVRPEELRSLTRAHIIAWRDDLVRHGLGGSTIRHRLASLASLFEYLCEKNAVTHNPVKGVERPKTESGEGKTPALGDHQARKRLDAPPDDTIKSKRDRAILSTLLFHALRREELCKLKVRDFRHARKGVPHLKVSGKGGKTRYLPLHPGTNGLVTDYLDAAGHGEDEADALFRPIRNNRTGATEQAITADGVYKLVRGYSAPLGFEIGAHALRATAATNALDHEADIAKVQEWLGHANIATARIYDRRRKTVQRSRLPIDARTHIKYVN